MEKPTYHFGFGDDPSAEMRAAFADADGDDDGLMGLDEFRAFMHGLEAGMSDAELRVGFREIDLDRDGRIDFDEFVTWWSDR